MGRDPEPEETDIARQVAFRGGGFAPEPNRWIGLAVFVVLISLAEDRHAVRFHFAADITQTVGRIAYVPRAL